MKNVLLMGQFTDISGYGNAVRSYFVNLKNLHDKGGINLKILNFSFEANSSISKEQEEEILKFSIIDDLKTLQGRYIKYKDKIDQFLKKEFTFLLFLTNDYLSLGKNSSSTFLDNGIVNINNIVNKSSTTFPCVVWETDKPPKKWIEGYKNEKIKKLICACDWNNKVFKKFSNKETITIPYRLNETDLVDEDFLLKLKNIINNKFSFCTVGQWGDRKGFDILLRAFYTEFYNEEVYLVIKTYRSKVFANIDEKDYFNKSLNEIKNSINNYGEVFNPKCKIILLTSLMNKKKINSIYKATDCYVTSTRGEGFGLPIAEYISVRKRPVIVPSKGGHLDFIHKDNYFIESSFEPVKGLNSLYSEIEMNYVEPSLRSLREKMRLAYNSKQMDNIGNESYEFLKDYLSDKKIESKFCEALEIK